MDRTSVDWSGPMPAVVTPFAPDGRILETAFADNLVRLLDAGATGFVVAGCTGEFWSLASDEKIRLYRVAREAVGARGTLIVGTGAIGVEETVALTRAAEAAGADGALILPPFFVKLTDGEILAHFRDVSARVGLPICLYNIPGNAVNAISPALAARLADLDRVVAIKESCGDWNTYIDTQIAVIDRLRVFCGPSSLYGVPAVLAGCDGLIDCFPNVWAPGGLDLWHATKAGRLDAANALQATGRALTRLFTGEGRTLYPATKAAMRLQGVEAGVPRPPLRPLDGDALAGLATGLASLGLAGGTGTGSAAAAA